MSSGSWGPDRPSSALLPAQALTGGRCRPLCSQGLASTKPSSLCLPSASVTHTALLLLAGFEHKITVQASPTLDKRKGSDGTSPPASPSIIPRLRAIRCEYRPRSHQSSVSQPAVLVTLAAGRKGGHGAGGGKETWLQPTPSQGHKPWGLPADGWVHPRHLL